MCEDPGCANRERAVSLHLERGYLLCPCKQGVMVKEYSDFDLHKQLNYFLYAFNFPQRSEEISDPNKKGDKLFEFCYCYEIIVLLKFLLFPFR